MASRSDLGRIAIRALLLLVLATPSLAQAQDASVAVTAESQAKIGELLELLSDPAVQDWLDRQRAIDPARPAAGADDLASPASYLSGRVDDIRRHVGNLAAALPTLPREPHRTGRVLGLGPQAQRPDTRRGGKRGPIRGR